MQDDAAYVAKVVEELANKNKDVLLISHSYGGMPMTESVKGLTKKERTKHGKRGGIVRLAYLTSLVSEVGQSGEDLLADVPAVPLEQQNDLRMDVSSSNTIFACLANVVPGTRLAIPSQRNQKRRCTIQ